MQYQPAPLDTRNVSITKDVDRLIDTLAKNAHEIWAAQRIREGWTWGPARDDKNKKHPCLVPYGQLPESEKEYDRLMSSETVKAVLSLGYRIEKND